MEGEVPGEVRRGAGVFVEGFCEWSASSMGRVARGRAVHGGPLAVPGERHTSRPGVVRPEDLPLD